MAVLKRLSSRVYINIDQNSTVKAFLDYYYYQVLHYTSNEQTLVQYTAYSLTCDISSDVRLIPSDLLADVFCDKNFLGRRLL